MSPQPRHPHFLSWTATELARAIRSREISSVEIIAASLCRIDEINPKFNAFTAVYREEAIALAREADAAAREKTLLGSLHGIPVAIKDMTPVKGRVTTLGSRAFARHVATEDAWIVSALRRAGAIVVGKTTTPEFAYSSFTQSPT